MGNRRAAPVEFVRSDIARVVVSRQDIIIRIDRLADEIARRYAGRELTILAVLTGSLMFVADLMRALSLPVRLDVVSVSSYPDIATRSCGSVFRLAPQTDLLGRDVLVVDDILDSGGTLAMLLETLERMRPASLGSGAKSPQASESRRHANPADAWHESCSIRLC